MRARRRGLFWGRRPPSIVLCYHRVASLARDPQLLAVTPERFAEHLHYLSERFELVPLARVRDTAPSRAPRIAVTFDDGYADNLFAATPQLEEQRVPATVFVCTGNLGTRTEFWWDELERIVLEPATLPAALETEVANSRVSYELSDDNIPEPAWNVLDQSDPSQRHTLYRELASLIRPLRTDAREAVLAELRAWAGVGEVGRESHRSLTEREVAAIASSPYVEIGAHTVHHPVLAMLSADAQHREIGASLNALRELTGRSVDSFAYPYGGATDYSSATVRILRESGLALACTTSPRSVVPRTDPFQIPRILVRNWNTSELQRRLEPFIPR